MKKISLLLVVCLFNFSFAGVCDDSLYQALKCRDLNTLSQNEMQYLLAKEPLCAEEQKASMQAQRDSVEHAENSQNAKSAVGAYVFLGILGVAAAVIVPIVIYNNAMEDAKSAYSY